VTYQSKEYRVWCETGDLVGLATVTPGNGWFKVTVDPFNKRDKQRRPGSFRNQQAAEDYARTLADRFMAEAIDWETKERGEPPVGVLTPHGYSIQEVENETKEP